MAARLFALIIGIDHYKSSGIWDLNSCVEDAKRIKRFLTNDLNVPREQICLLLNHQATKQAIEDSFMSHLVNNPAIEPGDAIVIYFAGHGSVLPAPFGWFQGVVDSTASQVEVLCPYDHDTKQVGGRVAGISYRSMHSLLTELGNTKGDNITLIVDCSFSPLLTPENLLDRSITRWTPTNKAKSGDLYTSLWPGARGQLHAQGLGFYTPQAESHIFLAACSPGDKAVEGKDGGRFTDSFLRTAAEISLHCISYSVLLDSIVRKMERGGQRPVCLGKSKSRIVFDAVPFVVDGRYVPIIFNDGVRPRLEVGAIHGVVVGSEFSIHLHNYRASQNPPVGVVVVSEVYPAWCTGTIKSSIHTPPKTCWAQMTRWNNFRPLRVHLRATITLLCRWWRLRRSLSPKPDRDWHCHCTTGC